MKFLFERTEEIISKFLRVKRNLLHSAFMVTKTFPDDDILLFGFQITPLIIKSLSLEV